MTVNIHNKKSIVENRQLVRLFIAFLLLGLVSVSRADGWRTHIEQDLLMRWNKLSQGHNPAATAGNKADNNSAVSFIGIGDDYQLPECRHTPQIRLVKALQPGRNGVEISCGTPYWKQHMAIQLQVYRQVVVLSQLVRRDDLLSSQHLHQSRQDIGSLSKGFYQSPDQVIGLQVKRALRPGTILSPDMLELPELVRRGQFVAIRIERPGIQVEMEGTAMGSGHQGERIRVRNNQSGKIISATIVARGLVQVE